jgi:hypothetical protein
MIATNTRNSNLGDLTTSHSANLNGSSGAMSKGDITSSSSSSSPFLLRPRIPTLEFNSYNYNIVFEKKEKRN